MAQVRITVTGRESSTVQIVYAPGEAAGRAGQVRKVMLRTRWSRADWERMRHEPPDLAAVAVTLGVQPGEVRAGIGGVRETVRHFGPAVYRAMCGKEICVRELVPVAKRLKEVLVAWESRPGAPEGLQEARPVPPECLACPRLRYNARSFWDRAAHRRVDVPMWWCPTFRILPGAGPPPAAELACAGRVVGPAARGGTAGVGE